MNLDFQEQVSSKSNEELLDIYIHADDYQQSFVKVVVQELKKRNVSLESTERQKEEKQKTKDQSMAMGVPGDPLYIVLGFISAFLGGFLGIVAGYVYSQSKQKNNPRGDFYVYDEPTRTKGYAMLVIGLLVFFGLLIEYIE
jgi:hypothetical protein